MKELIYQYMCPYTFYCLQFANSALCCILKRFISN